MSLRCNVDICACACFLCFLSLYCILPLKIVYLHYMLLIYSSLFILLLGHPSRVITRFPPSLHSTCNHVYRSISSHTDSSYCCCCCKRRKKISVLKKNSFRGKRIGNMHLLLECDRRESERK